jgi:hypothetical protein
MLTTVFPVGAHIQLDTTSPDSPYFRMMMPTLVVFVCVAHIVHLMLFFINFVD